MSNDLENSLHDLTPGELGQLFPVIMQEHNSQWFELYQSESQTIIGAFLPDEVFQIDHIGSTAIPGLMAKPTIDMLLQVAAHLDLKKLERILKSHAFQLTRQPENPPPHMTFVKGYSKHGFEGQAYHLHIRYRGDWDEIRFRDYLLRYPEVARDYEQLKIRLARQYPHDREAYTESKTDFINSINELTRQRDSNV